MKKVIICFRGLRFETKDSSIFEGYQWDKLKLGENIFSPALGWNSIENCGTLHDVFPDRVFIIYIPTEPINFNDFISQVECITITAFSSYLLEES